MATIVINVAIILESLPYLARGAVISLEIAALGCFFGTLLGTILGVLQSNKKAWLRYPVTLYVTIIRGTPMLIQIAFTAYALPQLIGITIAPFIAAVLAISLNSAAYVSQIIRSGIQAVNRGQIEAARVLGFTPWQTMRFIILPQAIRVVIPALGNEFITLVKDSSLASTIGVAELTKEAWIIKSRYFDALSVYTAVALSYLLITSILSLAVAYLEQKVNRYARH